MEKSLKHNTPALQSTEKLDITEVQDAMFTSAWHSYKN